MSRTPGLAADRIPARDADRAAVRRLAGAKLAAPALARALPQRPLDGVRVVEIGQYTTAPLSARHLAHLGAEVIKVEQPGGDESRTWVPHLNGASISFRLNNSDKRSMVLNLRTERGAGVLARLLETADILVENLKPGTLARFGFSPERLAALNPRLVYCAITGFGTDSIYAARPAFDMVIQAMSGFMAAVAPGVMPLKSGISTADTMGAEMAIVAMLAALEYRDRTGHGQYIDLSMQDISAWLTQTAWNRDGAPQAASPTMIAVRDGYVLAEATAETVRRHLPAAQEMDRAQAADALAAAGVRAAAVLSVRESAALPHTLDRRLWTLVADAGASWPILASPLRLQGTPPFHSHLSPAADADGPAILAELGLPVEAIASTA
jgi:crotonobetainyl-CoA:carnitine CoA-transferase CaiB-like acyl-CoA transferase